MKKKFIDIITDLRILALIYFAVALVASLLQFNKPSHDDWSPINNFLIFKTSFQHLISGGDLYQLWPADHQDYFKYSPTFALFMAPFAWMGNVVGLCIWNLLNALVLFYAISKSKITEPSKRTFILFFILLELLTNMQSSQSNGLMAGLMILGFNKMEEEKPLMAALFLCLGFYVKIFSLVGFLILLLYPHRIKAIAYSILWMIVLFILPLVAVSFSQLIFLYKSWGNLLANDHSASTGLSVIGWLQTWFKIEANKMLVLLVGAVLLLLPFIRIKQYQSLTFRLLMLSSVLVWVIIFNHKAESPTFIVAMCGIAIWYFSAKRGLTDTVLVCLAFLFTSLSPTDIFPSFIRKEFVIPFVLKAVPCILIWFKIIYELITTKFNGQYCLAGDQ